MIVPPLAIAARQWLGAVRFVGRWKGIFPHVGTRSAFLGLAVSLLAFFILSIKSSSFPKVLDLKFFKKTATRIVALLVIIAVLIVGVISFPQSRLYYRFKNNINNLITTGNLVKISPERYFLWKEAFSMMKNYPLAEKRLLMKYWQNQSPHQLSYCKQTMVRVQPLHLPRVLYGAL